MIHTIFKKIKKVEKKPRKEEIKKIFAKNLYIDCISKYAMNGECTKIQKSRFHVVSKYLLHSVIFENWTLRDNWAVRG